MSRSEDNILSPSRVQFASPIKRIYSKSSDNIPGVTPHELEAQYRDVLGGFPQIPSPSHQRSTSRHDTGGSRPKEVAFATPMKQTWQPIYASPSVTSFGEDDVEHEVLRNTIPPSIGRKKSLFPSTTNVPHSLVGTTSVRGATTQRSLRKDRTVTGVSAGNLIENPTDASTAWRECSNKLQIYDQSMVQGWKEEIDTLLVFAGLFSAVVTAFNVEAYKLLQEDPQDTTVILLTQIAIQLGANMSSPHLGNSSPSVTFSRRLNTLWFASLVFSLAAASIGILVKQWLREYLSGAASSPRENARIRQFRFEGLLKWKVPEIIAMLPVMLQIALAFFLVGLVYLLWSLDDVVAGVITIFVVASLLFLVLTTILPSIDGECPHRSPQALFVYLVRQWVLRKSTLLLKKIIQHFSSWSNRPWPLYAPPGMFRSTYRGRYSWIRNLLHGKYPTSWREREEQYVHDRENVLDQRVLSGADATFMDDPFLYNTLRYCIEDTECTVAMNSIQDILKNRAHAFLAGEPQWRHSDVVDSGLYTLINLVSDILLRMKDAEENAVLGMIRMLDRLCRAFPFEADHHATADLYRTAYETLASMLYSSDAIRDAAFNSMHDLFARSHVPVNDVVIESIISYTAYALQNSKVHKAYMACSMALSFTCLVLEQSPHLRGPIAGMLEDMEDHLKSPQFTDSGIHPSPTLLMAVLDIAELDRKCVSSDLIKLLNRLISGADYGGIGSQTSIDATVASSRAVVHLKERYPGLQHRPPIPNRKTTIQPVDNLQQLNLRLPSDEAPYASSSKASPVLTRSPTALRSPRP